MDNQTVIGANSKELFENTMFQEVCEFVNSENKKIIGISAKSTIEGYEAVADELRVTVKTVFRLISIGEDGKYAHDLMETEGVRALTKSGLSPTSCAFVQATVCDCSKSGTATVKCVANVELSGWFVRERELTFLSSCIEGAHCKSSLLTVDNVQCLSPGGLTQVFTDETRMNVDSLIDYRVESTVINVYPSSGSYRVEGDVFIRIFAQSDDGMCFSQLFSHPFSTEISDEDITSSSEIDLDVSVGKAELSLADGDKRMLICDVSLDFFATTVKQTDVERVVDVYSTENELLIEKSDEDIVTSFCLRSLHEKGTAKITPKDGVNEVCGVLNPGVCASYNKINGNVSVEGVITACVLYKNAKDKASSQVAEIPYQILLPVDFSCESRFHPVVCVNNITVRMRSGGDIDVTCELSVVVKGASTETVNVIRSITVGEPKEQNDFAVGLYIVKPGETLWDVAKALNTDEETLVSQNPDLALPLKGDERIILFNEKPMTE